MPLDSVPQPALTFGGVDITGIVERFTVGPPGTQLYRRHFSGIVGESELRGGLGGRTIEVQIVLAGDFDDRESLRAAYEDQLNRDLVQTNDTLTYSATDFDASYPECTFLGFFPDGRGPLLDEGGTLDGGWFCRGVLVFRQLRVA